MPNLSWSINNNTLYILGGFALVGGFLLYQGAKKVGDAINPTSTDNLAYKGISAVVDVLGDGVDNDSDTLGTAIYGATHDRPAGDYDEYRKAGLWLQGRVTGGEWEYIKMLGVN